MPEKPWIDIQIDGIYQSRHAEQEKLFKVLCRTAAVIINFVRFNDGNSWPNLCLRIIKGP